MIECRTGSGFVGNARYDFRAVWSKQRRKKLHKILELGEKPHEQHEKHIGDNHRVFTGTADAIQRQFL